jgi:hypothetical protein
LSPYIIEELGATIKVREAAPGTGVLCGSSYINKAFNLGLDEKFGHCKAFLDFTPEVRNAAMKEFENETKRGYGGGTKIPSAPLNNMPMKPALGIRRKGRLFLTKAEMDHFFSVVVNPTLTLVQSIIETCPVPVRAVLLVGGFGQSPCLKKELEELVKDDIEILQPANGDLAVVKGALSMSLDRTSQVSSGVCVTSRMARKSFGIEDSVPYNRHLHRDVPKYVPMSTSYWLC